MERLFKIRELGRFRFEQDRAEFIYLGFFNFI